MNVPDEQEFPLSPNNQTPVGLRVTPPTDSDVDGGGLMLTKIEYYLRSYLSFPDDRYYLPLALFAVLQHCWNECFDEVPYLSVAASVKGAGKTRVLELLQFLAGDERAVLLDGSVTLPALYMETDAKRVVLIDESERLLNPNSQFRPILNGGYRSGQSLKRKIGGEVKSFSIFGPKVFAQIGDVHDSLRDRCIVIEMQRTKSTSRTEFVRQTAMEEARDIATDIQAVLSERISDIKDSYLNYHLLYPSLDFLRDRDKEIWKPLFALCQVFAPERVPELERSAIDISTLKTQPVRRFEHLKDEEDKARKLEYAEHLLRDVIAVVGEHDRITTVELVKGLRNIGTSPWRSYEGAGITDISLAAMLKLFGAEPKTLRIKPKSEPNSTAKGYHRRDLLQASGASDAASDEERARNPVTPTSEENIVPRPVSSANLPILTECGGCKDMHRRIAALAEANPHRDDQELAEESGCSLTIVRQAKMRFLGEKEVA